MTLKKNTHTQRESCPFGFHFLYFSLLLLLSPENAFAAVPVKVGVVLNMNERVGKMGMASMAIALTDFYSAHPQFQTRLVLTPKNSGGDVITAASAVVDLLKNDEVKAIIGPYTSMEAYFVIYLGEKARVPIITFTATSPSLASIRSPYFFRTGLTDSSQVNSLSAIVQYFGWREVTLVYVDNEFGQGIVSSLSDALEKIDVRIPYRSRISSSASDDQIVAELYKLMSMQTRVFVVHMVVNPLGSRFFKKVHQIGMMSEDYAWIITDAMMNGLKFMNKDVLESMVGVLGVRPHVPKSSKLEQFQAYYKNHVVGNNGSELTIFGLWAYDTVTALAIAAENASTSIRNATFVMPNDSNDLERFGVSTVGLDLIRALSKTTFMGIAGSFRLIDQQLQSPPYEVVNLVGPGARVVGYWTEKNGIVKELNSPLKHNLKPIIWPGDRIYPPKGWVLPVNEKKLRVLVPIKKDRFHQFVDVTWNSDNSTTVKGLCIDVFDAVIAALPYGVPYEYIPSNADTYDEMVYQVHLKNYDALVGDVTIIANRSRYVDFTLPYVESGVSMLVPYINNNNKAWLFLKPLTWQLWLTSFSSFVTIAIVIWILEHKEKENEFKGTLPHQIGTILWYSFSTMVFSQRENIKNNLARIIMILWFFVVLILIQSYTASLASLLTVQQLHPSITNVETLIKTNAYIGYQEGSFMFGFLSKKGFKTSRLIKYSSPEELNELFNKGNGNGGIAAAFDEIPYLELFLSKYCSQYTMTGPIYKTDGFGFVFPTGSLLVSDISKAVLNVTESDIMFDFEKTWLRNSSSCPANLVSSSHSLGLESFQGLFTIVGAIAASFVVLYMSIFMWRQRDLLRDSDSSIWRRIRRVLQSFIEGYQNKTSEVPIENQLSSRNISSDGHDLRMVNPVNDWSVEGQEEEMETYPRINEGDGDCSTPCEMIKL